MILQFSVSVTENGVSQSFHKNRTSPTQSPESPGVSLKVSYRQNMKPEYASKNCLAESLERLKGLMTLTVMNMWNWSNWLFPIEKVLELGKQALEFPLNKMELVTWKETKLRMYLVSNDSQIGKCHQVQGTTAPIEVHGIVANPEFNQCNSKKGEAGHINQNDCHQTLTTFGNIIEHHITVFQANLSPWEIVSMYETITDLCNNAPRSLSNRNPRKISGSLVSSGQLEIMKI
jgi:hypothetical protein